MQLLIVTVCLALMAVEVKAAPPCQAADECSNRFRIQAQQAANDKYRYCLSVRQKIDCLTNAKSRCTPEQNEWIDDDIRTTRDVDPECASAVTVQSSLIGCILLAFISSFLINQ